LGYSVWPQPAYISRGSSVVGLNPSSLHFNTSSASALLKAAFARYQRNIFPFKTSNTIPGVPILSTLTVNIQDPSEDLQLWVNENYTVRVDTSVAEINAVTVFGALRGLESFSQLIDYDLDNKTYSISDTPVFIDDFPRFPWRGLMIDTGRHFLEVQTILTMIDAIAYNKMNTLHWHMIDLQSFPLQVLSFPNLAKYGAYSYPAATYSHSDVQTVVQYAYERGVRVVPEFDIPGHSYSWGLGYPELILNCSIPGWGTDGATLNITSEFTYQVLNGFLSEVKPLFMDKFIHFGSDEVHNITNFTLVEQYFEDRLSTLTDQHEMFNRVFWEDAFTNGVKFNPETTTFEIWLGLDDMVASIKAGFQTILANGFYLDIQKPGEELHYEWVDTWQDFYTNEPFRGPAENLTQAQRELLLGGEACMWGEAVEDENIFSRVWVRASGAAEKLWSLANFTNNPDLDAAQTRLIEFRCRLKRRGIRATPIRPDYCPSPFFP